VNEIELTLFLAHPGPPKETLQGMCVKFAEERAHLPRITFRRSREKVEIAHFSSALDARDWESRSPITTAQFKATTLDVIAAISLLKRKVKAKDAFDVNGFLAHCASRVDEAPESDAALTQLIGHLREREAKRRTEMSPWEKLGIDWRDYHPYARTILDDPFFWDCSDDFAPHGNDTGADILADFRERCERDHASSAVKSYLQTVASWHNADGTLPEIMREPLNEAEVAFAFAEIKLRGTCSGWSAAQALAAIARQKLVAEATSDWIYREERLRRLAQLEAKLHEVRLE
jgi:uncharacterized protein YfeS